MKTLPIEYLLIFLPMLMGIAAGLASKKFQALKPKIAIWIGWHFYHEDWRPNK